ncbi:22771_t:CDS:10 [Gigaspora margarita]|uniref:Ribonuclease n=1 Tax=Gigaspora margarita TaxID=4874 RepID=A0ABN7V3R0_GIGMA|nr:22771_t:CDS:10 [Gigaspora margarita]
MVTLKSSINETNIDEAGRGALAGPLVVAAVILPINFQSPFIQDSKILTPQQRNLTYQIIKKKVQIEEKNPLQATKEAMAEVLGSLHNIPDLALVDGREKITVSGIRTRSIIGGDRKSINIAAASIMAKVIRDTALFHYGICDLHRKTYEPIKMGEEKIVLSKQEALQMAQEKNLSLLCVAPTANPPVCKLVDYQKYLFALKKKKTKKTGLNKEIHRGLLVKVRLLRKNREKLSPELAQDKCQKLIAELKAQSAKIELQGPKMKLRLVSRNEIRAFVSKALETLREEIANHKASTIFVIVITFLLAQLEVKVFCDKEMGGLQRLDEKFGKVNREGTAENKLLAKITKMEETAKDPEEKTELERLISGLKKQIETDRAVSHQVDADYMKKPGNDFVDLKIPYYIFKQFHENEDGYFWQNEFIGLDKDAADHKKKEFIEIVNKEFERFIKEMKKPGPEELKKIEEKGKNPEES